ncbi:transcription antiterminator [Oceanobacillus kimchii]|uniref:glucose PTS transporter transcription antiterminator GlcT n=1 Tax=Oceanobacillus TaxID=182709 RepID=UPI00084E3D2F|nr:MULTISPECIES: transcription antiterminator [Oceanobacillus]MCT1575942.1 transcription antiterminator [Oceanobacillus kimchii]MCT2135579.1 transcription antiterminator [Oceanobacillus kimchii]OEH55682.1 transcriptional antiterminator [Oceanobacillus sp. E9]
MSDFIVKKPLNNNVLIALDNYQNEVVLIGSGIGFHYKKNDTIKEEFVEKLFVLRDQEQQDQYKKIVPQIDDYLLQKIIDSIDMIQKRSSEILNEQVHVALTDHLLFAINRLEKGMAIINPFLSETKILYPFEFEIASDIVDFLNQQLEISLPDGEIGFIALHVHSAIYNKKISDVNRYSQLITQLIDLIESKLNIEIDRAGIEYIRLVRHIRYTIDRLVKGEVVQEPKKIAELLKTEYPICYNLSWKLMKIMQQTIKKPVYEAEAVYLTMHLQRLYQKYE